MANLKSTQSASKTPFEIRLELLQMAKDHLDATFKMQADFATKYLEAALAAGKITTEAYQTLMPTGYSIEDITKKAAELYSFVQKKD